MHSPIVAASTIACLALLWGGAALGGEGVDIKITNDGTDDILVTVYDMNTNPKSMVLSNERINGFTSVPLTLMGDATGKANLSWTAVTADSTSRRCGHASAAAGNADSVSVHADSTCSA